MASAFGSSQIIELIAQDGVQFYIHEDTLVSQSEPFREAIQGVWTEANERKIQLKDWDSATVSRLVEYLYTGDYPCPDPCPIHRALEQSGDDKTESHQTGTVDSSVMEVAAGADLIRPLTPLVECMVDRIPLSNPYRTHYSDKLYYFSPADHDFKEVLLTHAKVYALAQYKAVKTLRTMALTRVYSTLQHINEIPSKSHLLLNIVELASYTYANTDEILQSEEPLRRLVSHFTVLNFAAILTVPEAVDLISTGGDFVRDVMLKIRRRLPDIQDPTWGLPYTGKGYVSGLHQVRGGCDPPADHVRDLCMNNANLGKNWVSRIWLVPEYSTNVNDACTSFNVSTVSSSQGDELTLTLTNPPRTVYVQMIKDKNIEEKVTHVALARSGTGALNLKPIKGYTSMSSNMNPDSENKHRIYLVWRSAKISLV